jgi:hypothetical protein
MTRRLNYDEKEPERPRREFDRRFHVADWQLLGFTSRPRERTDGAPSWWVDDEDSSQSFLAAMGVIVTE